MEAKQSPNELVHPQRRRLAQERQPRPSVEADSWLGVGPFTDAQGVAQVLGVSLSVVYRRGMRGELLGLQLRGNRRRRVYPTWQLDQRVMSALPRVLATAGYDPAKPDSGWAIASWLVASDVRFDDRSALDLLTQGELETVLRMARDIAFGLDQ